MEPKDQEVKIGTNVQNHYSDINAAPGRCAKT